MEAVADKVDQNKFEIFVIKQLIENPELIKYIDLKRSDFRNHVNKRVFSITKSLFEKDNNITSFDIVQDVSSYLEEDGYGDFYSLYFKNEEYEERILEYEKKLLSTLIANYKIIDFVKESITKEDFLDHKNRVVYEAILDIYEKGDTVGPSMLIEYLIDIKMLEFVGGKQYIIFLLTLAPLDIEFKLYIKKIKEASDKRFFEKKKFVLNESLRHGDYDTYNKIKDQIDERIEKSKEEPKKDLDPFETFIQTIEKEENFGTKTEFFELDEKTNGFRAGELITLGARPGIGKTSLIVNMMENIAIDNPVKNRIAKEVGFFSLEMPEEDIIKKVVSSVANIDNDRIKKSKLTKGDLANLEYKSKQLSDMKLRICDESNIELSDLETKARIMKRKHDIKILFIDYIGLIKVKDMENNPVYERVSHITKSLKALAKKLEIPIVVLSQITRDSEGKEPTLNQLRSSGSIEEDSDIVMFLHRQRELPTNENTIPSKLIIAKNRHGVTGQIDLDFKPSFTRFESKFSFD